MRKARRKAFVGLPGAVLALAFAGASGAVGAQVAMPPPLPASAPVPASAASAPVPQRSPAVKAAEAAKEPGKLVPEQRVIPQISIPLKNRNIPSDAEPAASATPDSVPGTVNDGAARCVAARDAKAKAACESAPAASAAHRMGR